MARNAVAVVALVAQCAAFSAPKASAAPRRRGDAPRATLAAEDLSGDGGVLKRDVPAPRAGGVPKHLLAVDGDVAVISYSARVAGTNQLLASSESALYTIGDESWVKGWDLALRTMRVGESAKFELESAYGYGAAGLPPAVPPDAALVFDVKVLDYRGNVRTASSFVTDNPLTLRTPESIKQQYEQRMEAKKVRLADEAFEKERRDSASSPSETLQNVADDLVSKFKGWYFFGFFESATGEETPWFLQPMITFPAIFVGVALSYGVLQQSGAILVKGTNPIIPGLDNFGLDLQL
ncbi:hypothetical protein M885DRAFT_509550 [Pelagophyceae sp. CCMP2097]|nr:hypothetical protein M885DRAFT_509550 [Pelagophyceae sp. CCMP2097]